jgi:DNA-binding beta-propeller fold protein YncE
VLRNRATLGWIFSLLCAFAGEAAAAQSFAYVATCEQSSSCATPSLLVYDTSTARLVTTIQLPSGTPRQAAMTSDGTRLYVSIGESTGGWLAVVDTTTHVLIGAYPAPGAGDIAVARDNGRVFVVATTGSDQTVYAFEAATHVFAPFIPGIATGGYVVTGITTNPGIDRLYVSTISALQNGPIRAYDSNTGLLVASETPTLCFAFPTSCPWPIGLAVSPDGARVYRAETRPNRFPSVTLATRTLDPLSLQGVTDHEIGPTPGASCCSGNVIAEAQTLQRLFVGAGRRVYWSKTPVTGSTTVADSGSLGVPGAVSGVAISRDETQAWIGFVQDGSASDTVNGIAVIDTATGTLSRTITLASGPTTVVTTPKNAAACSYTLDKSHTPWAIPGGTTTIKLTTPCAWSASSDADWARIDSTTGLGSTMFTLTVDPNPLAATRTATLIIAGQVVTVTQAGGASTAPFGFIDTPVDQITGVAGELAVTGWALDDVGVTRVQIFRDPVEGEPGGSLISVGDATLVDGARPDVQAAYPFYPFASRAGWGYMLLTNMLPESGTGTYRLTAIATDIEGRQTVLGSRAITCSNSTSALPFGTIDTPGQGQTVSGTILNFGWALTPQPSVIPFDGSTIDVVIDGVVVGHPTYGFARSDVDALFPNYANTGRAVGYLVIDTTTLTNGLHTIAWIVRDNMGATAGVGARFFTVINP